MRAEPQGAHDVDGGRHQLGISQGTGLADDVHVELEMLPEPSPLLSLVAKQLGDGEPSDRLLERLNPRRDHACQRRRHFRAERDFPVAFVSK